MGESGEPIELPRVRLDVGLQRFEGAMRRRGRAPGTIQTYGWALRYLLEYLEVRAVTCFDELRREHLEGWQDQLLRRQLAAKTRSVSSTAVRQFLRWAIDEDLVEWRLVRAVEAVRTRPGRPRPIPLPDLLRIQAHIAPLRPRMTERELRDRALFTVLLVTGARVSEVLQMRREHFASDRPIVIRQKGGTEKELFITPTVRERVLDYLRRRVDVLPELWVTSVRGSRRPMSREIVRHVWSRLARYVGVPRWTTHQLRHTCATELKRAGVSDLVIAQHLGHHNLSTLANYAAVVDEHRAAKLEVLEGLLAQRASDGLSFRRPVALRRSRPDNRRRRVGK